MNRRLERLKGWARRLKRDVRVVLIAARDPRTPRHARWLALAVAAYALSPIDLIPDAVPVLGLLDDLIIVPLGIWWVIRLLPAEVLADARAAATAAEQQGRPSRSLWGAAFIVALWVLTAWLLWRWWAQAHAQTG